MQRSLSSEKGPGEFMFNFDGDEIFHVDLERKETIWRLPQFGEFASFQAEGAQGNMAVLRSNLGILMHRSNNTPAQNGTAMGHRGREGWGCRQDPQRIPPLPASSERSPRGVHLLPPWLLL